MLVLQEAFEMPTLEETENNFCKFVYKKLGNNAMCCYITKFVLTQMGSIQLDMPIENLRISYN